MGTVTMWAATRDDLEELNRALTLEGLGAKAVRPMVASLGSAPVPYDKPSHYLAFVLAYLQDEGVLPDNDETLTDGLFQVRGRLTDVLPRKGVKMEQMTPELYDINELCREFHAGGPLSHPQAGHGLLEAIRVLRENFSRLNEDAALIIGF